MRNRKDGTPRIEGKLGAASESNDQTSLRRELPSPQDLMRFRHPDLFSDTRIDDIPRLPKTEFEYHLDTLTSRKQEYQFEHFCRKLAEKEICPNLRVQTGPTGGGDSKVDSETYPVAEEIAERWWIGSSSAGAERWAFAFSAKKDWKSKVKADVKNILSTGRDYKLIYFFTNQFVSDKARSTHEDKLLKDAGIPVHIIDRAWIVEKVYEADHRHIETYFAALGIENVQRERTTRTGPRDTARLQELEELDQQVADPSRYHSARYQLVEDCLRSAILARSLERPRSEVESRFAQADRLALDANSNRQRLRIAYNRAWTAFWWYGDYTEFGQFYENVEQRAEKSVQASDVELLLNLWMLLLPSMAASRIETQDAKIESRSQRLATMLEAMVADTARFNNALQARTSLILMRTVRAYHSRRFDEVEDGWRDLAEVVDQSEGLGAYSLERLFGLVRELGEYVDGSAFDALYDKLANAMKKRRSDGEAGVAYLNRAKQKIGQEKPYEAIQWFGRAEELLIKDEYRGKLVVALIGVSSAFEQVGLLWAARNKALAAADRTLESFFKEGKIISQAMTALNRLVWIELRLGRIPHILDAINLARSVASNLNVSEDQQEAYAEELQMQELVLGIHLLNLPLTALSSATRLPSILQRLGFESARMAMLFVLGHEQVLRKEGYIPVEEDAEAVQTIFMQWQEQPAAKDISSLPVLVDGKASVLKSTILGSEIVVETPNNETSFGVAESLLGALEAFLSTSDEQGVFPYREQMTIVITESAQLEGTPQTQCPDSDSSRVEIQHPAELGFPTGSDRQNFMKWLQESVVQVMCRMLMMRDADAWLEQVANRERGFSRALTLGDALTLNRNVFGERSRIRLTDWLEQDDESYPLLRNKPWRTVKASAPKEPPKFATEPPPKELPDREKLKHTDRRILSPIDIPLWDRAKWRGTLFVWNPDGPPILAIGFEDGEAGQAIFGIWKERWGDIDEDDDLRVAIITGLSKRNPAEYAVVVGPNLRYVPEGEKKLVLYVSRIHRMTPDNSRNLENFLQFYNRTGYFFLAPAQINTDGKLLQMPARELALLKRKLYVRQAWQIGENDPDIAVFDKDDEPIVPEGVTDPPVNTVLRRIRSSGL
ncbi:MAG: hypothetical protein OXL95_09115 [Nitrospira sp.]|nr:hypothetical protein [Nitrospira sp.]